ncbi:unnamed protein product, partial [Brassica oleracea]
RRRTWCIVSDYARVSDYQIGKPQSLVLEIRHCPRRLSTNLGRSNESRTCKRG